jgi:allantoinase
MSFDVLIRGATVAGAGPGERRLDVGVADGLIAAIDPELSGLATEELDAAGLHLLPGVIDAHVHFNEPGRTDWEGFETGTRALAAGGATSAIEMPLNAHPPTVTGAAFDEKRRCLERCAFVDIGLWGGLVPGGIEAMDELAARGVVGFKAFMCSSGIDDFPGVDDLTLYEGMCRAASLGLPVAVHAESEAMTAGLARRARTAGRTAMRDFLASRPAVAELQAIARAIVLARESGCSLHIVHVSTGRGAALVADARARGIDVSCETCPHYLVLADEDAEVLGNVAKCAPPLRPREELEALWHRLAEGTLPMVASDHSPAPWGLKRGEDAFAAWGGISGCQTMLALLLTEGHHARGLKLELIARVTSGYVARRFRLAGKGRLEPGADADLVLVDLGASDELSAEDLHYRHRHSPFLGRTLSARVVRTLVRGRTVFADGRVVGPPAGRLLTPTATEMEST